MPDRSNSSRLLVPVSAASQRTGFSHSNIRWDTLVVGGGVMGLMTALTLADRGQRVGVIDAGRFGGEASWAAGGILMPLSPWSCDDALSELLMYSLKWMPELCARLATETQVSPELVQHGMRILNLGGERYKQLLNWAQKFEIPVVAKTPLEISKSMGTAPEALKDMFVTHGDVGLHQLLLPTVYTVRPPRLLKALVRCLRAHPNVGLYSSVDIDRIALEVHDGAQVVRLSDGSLCFEAENCVLAAGAWTGTLAEQLGWAPDMKPVQGQMLLLKFNKLPIDEVILSKGRYLIPRSDGRVLVGSTIESHGFTKKLSQEGYDTLFTFAKQFLGDLDESCIEAQWNGIRPALTNDLPLIGHHPLSDKVWFNTGHYRSGIALSIGSARLVSDQILGRNTELDSSFFAPKEDQLMMKKG